MNLFWETLTPILNLYIHQKNTSKKKRSTKTNIFLAHRLHNELTPVRAEPIKDKLSHKQALVLLAAKNSTNPTSYIGNDTSLTKKEKGFDVYIHGLVYSKLSYFIDPSFLACLLDLASRFT